MAILRWVLVLMLAAFFVYMGAQKFGTHNALFEIIAQKSGISIFEPQVRVMTGVAEIFAALLMIAPKFRKQGLLLALAILVGAIGFHLSPWLGISVEGMGNGVFVMALGALVLTLAVMGLEKAAKASAHLT